jgi:hypothetical protein
MSELGQSPLKCNARDVSAFTPPPRPNSAHQETSQTCLIRGVVGFMRKIV